MSSSPPITFCSSDIIWLYASDWRLCSISSAVICCVSINWHKIFLSSYGSFLIRSSLLFSSIHLGKKYSSWRYKDFFCFGSLSMSLFMSSIVSIFPTPIDFLIIFPYGKKAICIVSKT